MEGKLDSQYTISRSRMLLAASSVFGLLYLWFIAWTFFPASDGSWVSTTVPFDPFDREQVFVKLLFLFFLTGYVVSWRNELVGGILFILYWVAMWLMVVFVEAPLKGGDAGGGIVMGFPVFILGILFVWRWYRAKRSVSATVTTRTDAGGR